MNQKKLPGLALFDFDGTLTAHDTLPLFIKCHYTYWQIIKKMIYLSRPMAAYICGFVDNQRAKEAILCTFFQGWTHQQFTQAGQQFIETIDMIIRPKALDKIEWHKRQGHQIFVVSASPEEWVKPWSKCNGLACIATKLEYVNGVFTGKIKGLNCYGPEKVQRIKAEFQGDLTQLYIYAYGDSHGDIDMLALASESFFNHFH